MAGLSWTSTWSGAHMVDTWRRMVVWRVVGAVRGRTWGVFPAAVFEFADGGLGTSLPQG